MTPTTKRLGAGADLMRYPGMMVLTSWLHVHSRHSGAVAGLPQLKRETAYVYTRQALDGNVGLPCRYLGSPYQMMSQRDIDYAQQLITDALMRLASGESPMLNLLTALCNAWDLQVRSSNQH